MKLVTMEGRQALGAAPYQFSLFSLSGEAEIMKIDPKELSDLDAGVYTLFWLNKMYPGITWGEIISASKKMSGWLKSFAGWVGKGTRDMGNKLGDWGGDAVRLVTDRQVVEGVGQYAQMYANYQTGGLAGLTQGMGLPAEYQGQVGQLISQLGINTKKQIDPMIIYGGLGLAGLLVLAMVLKK